MKGLSPTVSLAQPGAENWLAGPLLPPTLLGTHSLSSAPSLARPHPPPPRPGAPPPSTFRENLQRMLYIHDYSPRGNCKVHPDLQGYTLCIPLMPVAMWTPQPAATMRVFLE